MRVGEQHVRLLATQPAPIIDTRVCMPPWTLASFTRAPCEGRHNATSKKQEVTGDAARPNRA